MTLVMKVVCGQCGNKIGEVHNEVDGVRFRPIWPTGKGVAKPQPADSINAARFWCLEHGWTDPSEIERAATKAFSGKVATHRARVSTQPPW